MHDSFDVNDPGTPLDLAPTRRQIWRMAAGGVILAASGLLLPASHEAAEARKHGKAKTRRSRRRKRERKALRQGSSPFRNAALTVVNRHGTPLTCDFYYQVHVEQDTFQKPTHGRTQIIAARGSERYDPGYLRVGALIREIDPGLDLYVDVRNIGLWYPRGGVYRGADLKPEEGQLGDSFIPEQNFSQGETKKRARIELHRGKDTQVIEWVLSIGPGN